LAKKKTKTVTQDGDGEAWIGSYADLMTLLLCFFILLYSFSFPDEGKMESLSQTLSKAFKGDTRQKENEVVSKVGIDHQIREIRALHMVVSLLGLGETSDAVKKIEDAYIKASESEKIQDILKKELSITDDLLKYQENKTDDVVVSIHFGSDLLFPSGQADLSPSALAQLNEIAKAVKETNGLSHVEIIGHTDPERLSPRSEFKNNWHLSAARAGAVAEWFVSNGISPNQIRASGMADASPLFPNYDSSGAPMRENMTKNRRIEVLIKRRPEAK
jgi:chemotaxis protein MotB